jgi:hypothetical protein
MHTLFQHVVRRLRTSFDLEESGRMITALDDIVDIPIRETVLYYLLCCRLRRLPHRRVRGLEVHRHLGEAVSSREMSDPIHTNAAHTTVLSKSFGRSPSASRVCDVSSNLPLIFPKWRRVSILGSLQDLAFLRAIFGHDLSSQSFERLSTWCNSDVR